MTDPAPVPAPLPVPVPVLWCPQCNKPFTQQSALKRHGYYCRSLTSPPAPRRRSCAACAQAKTACDHVRPQCSRCAHKGWTCQYPARSAPKRRVSLPPHAAAAAAENAPQQPTVHDAAAADPPTDLHRVFQGMTPASDGAALFGTGQWGFGDDMSHLADFAPAMSRSAMPSEAASNAPSAVSPVQLSTSAMPGIQAHAHVEQFQPMQQHSPPSSTVSIPPVPNPHVRSMMSRPRSHPSAERAANLIFYTLKSYPVMLRHHHLPPFIHPNHISFHGEDNTAESMANCVGLLHMMAAGVHSSRKLFWRNVKQECERICDQNRSLSKWELLGAMQALSIYVLIRLDEGETDHNNFDFLLERAVILIAMQLSHDDSRCHAHQGSCESKSGTNWEDWVYKESRRRLAVIYRLLNKLIFFTPAAMCEMPEEFLIAPLPAKRQLWEAADAQQWKMEGQKEPGPGTSYALAVDGEIVKLDKQRLSCRDAWLPYLPSDEEVAVQNRKSRSSRSAAWWVEWAAGMDGFGSLIMLAASIA